MKSKRSRGKTGNAGRRKTPPCGVTRGLDFQNVTAVVNLDFPSTVKSYVHRVGRTARAGKSGEALSLVSPAEVHLLDAVLDYQKLSQADDDQLEVEPSLKLLQFNMSDVEGFRYRVEDVSRGVTKAAVREARLKELKAEMLNSEKLKAHFEDNPRELDLLKHDKVLRSAQVSKHLAHVPSYLQPRGAGAKPISNTTTKKKRVRSSKKGFLARKRTTNDPLTSFAFKPQENTLVLPSSGNAGAFSNSRVGIKDSTSGRRAWKAKHASTGKKDQSHRRKKSNKGALYQGKIK
jgi:ATP-dependent RNA helicase DDX56/DBP9